MAKIDGYRYVLAGIGMKECERGYTVNKEASPRKTDSYTANMLNEVGEWEEVQREYTYHWRETEPGAPARIKSATKAQVASWPELAEWRESKYVRPYLLWLKEESK